MLIALITLLTGGASTALGLYLGVIRPREKERKAASAAAAEKQAIHDQILDGVPPVPGMTEGQLAIAVRVQATEREVEKMRLETKQNTDAVYNMSLRINQSNGKVAEIFKIVNALVPAIAELLGRPIALTTDENAAHDLVADENRDQILRAIESQ